MNEEVLTLAELSEYLKIPRSTLYRLVRKGEIPGRKVGRSWRFHRGAIDRWLQSQHYENNGRKERQPR